MSVRFLYFEIRSENPSELLKSVVSTLNKSFIKDTTALGLLRALSQYTEEEFSVYCEGDYCTVANACELREAAPEPRDLEWLGRIASAVDRRRLYGQQVDRLLNKLPHSVEERKKFLKENEELLTKAGGYYTSTCWREQNPYDGGEYINIFVVFDHKIELDTYESW